MSESSYVVLGFVRRLGSATPYDLKQRIAESVGYFWDFPHSQLYTEPARLAELGLLREKRETDGRRRRIYTITASGSAALDAWLDDPPTSPTEIRDVGLLKLFFSDSREPHEIARLAELQIATHRARLAEYEVLSIRLRIDGISDLLSVKTLDLGLRYEQMTIDFWTEILTAAEGPTRWP